MYNRGVGYWTVSDSRARQPGGPGGRGAGALGCVGRGRGRQVPGVSYDGAERRDWRNIAEI